MVFKGYRQTSAYGWRMHPIQNVNKFHAGIDLVKSHNAPIGAFIPGKVLYAGLGKSGTGVGGYGNVVVIQDSTGAANVYCHLNSVAVKKGQYVNKGDTIGRQGATGQVTGSHLHFEVRKKSAPNLGWTVDQSTSTLDPAKHVGSFEKAVAQNSNSKYPKKGDKGSNVGKWQRKLKDLGYYKGKIDDSFGPATDKATRQFQKDNNLAVDGQAGPKSNSKADQLIKNKNNDFEWVGTKNKGKRVVSIHKGKLNYYDGPRWTNPTGTFSYGQGWKVDNLYRVKGSLMYRVQNSKGKLYWITAASKYVAIK